jgi:hypothetical protein
VLRERPAGQGSTSAPLTHGSCHGETVEWRSVKDSVATPICILGPESGILHEAVRLTDRHSMLSRDSIQIPSELKEPVWMTPLAHKTYWTVRLTADERRHPPEYGLLAAAFALPFLGVLA